MHYYMNREVNIKKDIGFYIKNNIMKTEVLDSFRLYNILIYTNPH